MLLGTEHTFLYYNVNSCFAAIDIQFNFIWNFQTRRRLQVTRASFVIHVRYAIYVLEW